MAETHLLMHVAAFLGALWWTKHWMLEPTTQRWRFILSSLASVPLWILVAYTATRAVEGSSGVGIVYESLPIAYFGALMAFLSLLGFVLGLFLWTEEDATESAAELPDSVSGQFGD